MKMKKIIAVLAAVSMIPVPFVKADDDYAFKAGFEATVTNVMPATVVADGSPNARVVLDGVKNKAFYTETAALDNQLVIPFSKSVTNERYFVSFDIKSEKSFSEGLLTLTDSTSKSTELLKFMTDGTVRMTDNKIAGGISNGRYTNIALLIDNRYKFVSVYVDGNLKIHRWILSATVKNPVQMLLDFYETGVDGSGIYLDNIKVYNGEEIKKGKVLEAWNESEAYFERAEDEESGNVVYFSGNFDKDINVVLTPKTNTIEQKFEKDGNGYIEMRPTGAEDFMIDIKQSVEAREYVIEMDISYDKTMMPTSLFMLRDTVTTGSNLNAWGPSTLSDGTVKWGGISVNIKPKKWTKISFAVNTRKSLTAMYVNGEKIVDKVPFDKNYKILSLLRIYSDAPSKGATDGNIKIDNVRIYEGSEPREISAEESAAASLFSNNIAESFLKSKTALMPYSNKIWYANRKTDTDTECINYREDSLVSPDTFEKLFGIRPEISGNSIKAGDAQFTVGESKIRISGKDIKIPQAPELKDGVVMLPVDAFGKNALKDKYYINDSHGLFIVSPSPVTNIQKNDVRMIEANLYMFFERYTKDELKEKFLANNDNGNKHPRIWRDEAGFSQLRSDVENDAVMKEWYASIKETADSYINEPLTEYYIDNGRLLDISKIELIIIPTLAMMYQITGEEKYAKRCYERMSNVCKFPDWHPEHELDSGTMAHAVALGYDWIYHYLTEEQREEIFKASYERGIRWAAAAYNGSSPNGWWAKTTTNWGFIVNAGYSALAMAFAERDPDYYMELIRNAYQSAEQPIYQVAPDGAWHEGPGYWGYGNGFQVYLMYSYESIFKEKWNYGYMGLQNLGAFAAQGSDPKYKAYNYGDADEGTVTSWLQLYLAKEYNDIALTKWRLKVMKNYSAPVMEDLLFYDTRATAVDDNTPLALNLDEYFREVELVSMRENFDDAGAGYFSVHGGLSNQPHDHVDSGSFIFNVGGTKWAIDLGKDDVSYALDDSMKSEGAKKYPWGFYRRKGEGHNILVINPKLEQEMDIDKYAKMTAPVSAKNGAYTTMDLTDMYHKEVNSYTRGYLFSDSRRSLTVRDEVELKGESEMYWFMHTKGQIVIEDNNTAFIVQDGKVLKVQLVTDAKEYSLTSMAAETMFDELKFDQDENDGITKLALKLKSDGKVNITAKLSLLNESGSNTPPTNIPISEWSENMITEGVKGECTEAAKITVGQNPITMLPKVSENVYQSVLDESGTLPEIKVKSENQYTVNEYNDDATGGKLIAVRVFDNNGKSTFYVITFKPYDPDNIANFTRHQVISADVSSEQTDGESNLRGGSYDGDLATRWSAEGVGEWMIHDLGEIKEVDAIGIAFWMGNRRKFSYDILVSSDGVNFEKVIDKKETSGTTENIEVVRLADRVNARYIKFVGYGSNVNSWNNVIELATLKKN